MVIRCASSNRLLLQARNKNTGFGDRHHAQWVTLWSYPGAAQTFSPHHSLTAPREGGERKAGLDSQVGYDLLRRFLKHCVVDLKSVMLLRLVSENILIYKLNECSISFTRERGIKWFLMREHIFLPAFINLMECLYEPVTYWVIWMTKETFAGIVTQNELSCC